MCSIIDVPLPASGRLQRRLGSRQRLSAGVELGGEARRAQRVGRSMERPPDTRPPEDDDQIGYRNASEEADYDKRGSQSPGPGEPPVDEPQPDDDGSSS